MVTPPVTPPLRAPVYRRLWLANVCSGIGSSMHDTAAIWTMSLMTSSPLLVTLVQSTSSVALFLFGLPAGALADILDRRRVIFWAQIGCLLVAGTLGVLAIGGHLSIGLLLTATFLLGAGTATTMPSWQSIIPEIVDRKQLPAAITLGSVGINIARAAGPMFGGLLLGISGPGWVFLINSLSFVGVVVALILWQRPAPPADTNSERMLGAMAAAFRYTRHSTAIHAVLIRQGWFVFCAIAPTVLLPLILRSHGASAMEFGLQMGAYGVGGVTTAFLVLPRLRERLSLDSLMTAATTVSSIALAGLGLAKNFWMVGALMFVAGAAWLANMTTLALAGQSAFPNWVRARSSAVQLLVVQGGIALGALLWGQFTVHFGAPAALRVAAAGVLSNLILVRRFPLNYIVRLDLTPSTHWPEHQLEAQPHPDEGPVLISVDYEIPTEHHESFRIAMGKLRRVRLRDGAFRWALFQDLASTRHFRESFLVGSWAEHLRQHTRATVADKQIEESANGFHDGIVPPRVSHFVMNEVSDTRLRTGEATERTQSGER